MKSLKFMANLLIIGFVVGRALTQWQQRARIIAVRPAGRRAALRPAASEGWHRQPSRSQDPRY